MKFLKFDVPLNSKVTYTINCERVAKSRADYFAIEVDGYDKGSKEYEEEVQYGMDNVNELIEWLTGNQYFKDWSGNKSYPIPTDKQQDWPDADEFYVDDVEVD